MKTAFITFNADGTMTLVRGKYFKRRKHFDRLSRLVIYCRDNNIQARPEPALVE